MIVFDCETVAPTDKPWWPELVASARPSGETWGAAEQLRWGATHPVLAQVVCVGMIHTSSGAERVYCDDNEERLLREIAEIFGRTKSLATFGGQRFDVPLLINRIVSHGIEVPEVLRRVAKQKPWQRWPHSDVRLLLGHGDLRQRGTLRDFCLAWGVEDPKAGDCAAEDVGHLFRHDPEWREKVGDYCLADCRAATELLEIYDSFIDPKKEESCPE